MEGKVPKLNESVVPQAWETLPEKAKEFILKYLEKLREESFDSPIEEGKMALCPSEKGDSLLEIKWIDDSGVHVQFSMDEKDIAVYPKNKVFSSLDFASAYSIYKKMKDGVTEAINNSNKLPPLNEN